MGVKIRVPLIVVVSLLAAALATTLESPARAIEIPRTLHRTVVLDADAPERVVLETPATHVAFSWEGGDGTGVRYRTMRADGSFTRWRRAVESVDARRGNSHYSAVLWTPRAPEVEWRPVVPRGAWMGRVVLDALNTLDGPRTTVEIPDVSYAAAGAPRVVTRQEWGADESVKRTSGSCKRRFFPVQQLFVHHTAGRNNDPNPKATMRAIYWYHAVRQGWCDVGYNFVIGPKGVVYEGRWARSYRPWETHTTEDRNGRAVSGAHVSGFNSGSVGVSLMGNYQVARIPQNMRRSLAEFLAWEADRHKLPPRGKHTYVNPETGLRKQLPYIAGHRDAGSTSCPGKFVYKALPGIRTDTKAVMGGGKAVSSTSLEVESSFVAYGESATVSGAVRDGKDVVLGGHRVLLYVKPAGAPWRVGEEITTELNGTYSATFSPVVNTRVVAVYEGDADTWGSESRGVKLKVRPNVSLVPEGGVQEFDGTYRFPAGTTSVRLKGDVEPAHAGHEVKVKVGIPQDDNSTTPLVAKIVKLNSWSAYTYDFSVPGPGTYRAVTWFRKDKDHAASPSAPAFFVIDG